MNPSADLNRRKVVALLNRRIKLEERRMYRSSYDQECFEELIEIRRLLRARRD